MLIKYKAVCRNADCFSIDKWKILMYNKLKYTFCGRNKHEKRNCL